MARRFERCLSGLHTRLQPGERTSLYRHLLGTVARVREQSSHFTFGGILVDSRGYVLTHGKLNVLENFTVEFKHGKKVVQFSARLAYFFKNMNLSLLDLQPDKEAFDKLPEKWDAIFAESSNVAIGMEIHALGLNYRYTTGSVSYPNRRLDELIFVKSLCDEAQKSGINVGEAFNTNLTFIQCQHMVTCYGDPIFNSLGELLGLNIFCASGLAFYVDLTDETRKNKIRSRIKKCEERKEEERKKEERRVDKEDEQEEKGKKEEEQERERKRIDANLD